MASRQLFVRGLRKLLIAPWVSENSYGTVHTILGAQNLGIQGVYESDEARGDDVVLDRYSKPISFTITMQMATVDLTLFNLLMGGTLTFNDQYYDVMFGEDSLPDYVAVAGRVVTTNGQGDLHFFGPKCKLQANPQFNATQDAYIFPQFELQGVHEGEVNGIGRFRDYSAPTALEIPLRLTTGGF